jgi:hypothetical protein
MSNPSYYPWIRREDYESFRRICPDDLDFPDTYEAWFQLAEKHIGQAEARGVLVHKVEVYPQEFAAWGRASGIETNGATLNAFAIGKANKR